MPWPRAACLTPSTESSRCSRFSSAKELFGTTKRRVAATIRRTRSTSTGCSIVGFICRLLVTRPGFCRQPTATRKSVARWKPPRPPLLGDREQKRDEDADDHDGEPDERQSALFDRRHHRNELHRSLLLGRSPPGGLLAPGQNVLPLPLRPVEEGEVDGEAEDRADQGRIRGGRLVSLVLEPEHHHLRTPAGGKRLSGREQAAVHLAEPHVGDLEVGGRHLAWEASLAKFSVRFFPQKILEGERRRLDLLT